MLPFVLECRVLVLDDVHTFLLSSFMALALPPSAITELPYHYLSLSSLCVKVLPTYMHTDRREG
jgi:hypothetical protein